MSRVALAGAFLALGGLSWLVGQSPSGPVVIGRYETTLVGRTPGQRHNAIRALGEIQGVRLMPGQTFSFNGQVHSWTRDQGYVKAPVSYSGQLIPGWGGGVCQTSTTLYNAALLAGLEIVERHRHEFTPDYVPAGLDAAVAYESIDLKIRNPWPIAVSLRCARVGDSIRVECVADRPVGALPTVSVHILATASPRTVEWGSGDRLRVRTGGKAGREVVVWRRWRDRDEFISRDRYPVMHRLVERT